MRILASVARPTTGHEAITWTHGEREEIAGEDGHQSMIDTSKTLHEINDNLHVEGQLRTHTLISEHMIDAHSR